MLPMVESVFISGPAMKVGFTYEDENGTSSSY